MNTPTDRSAPATVSRRTIAAGLAWSVPTIAAASAAPAFAASGITVNASTCKDYTNACKGGGFQGHLSGRTANGANLYIYHGFTAGPETVPTGTSFTWIDSFYVKTADVATQMLIDPSPGAQRDTYGVWSTSKLRNTTEKITLGNTEYTKLSYTVNYVLTRDVPAGGSICSFVNMIPAYIRKNSVYPNISVSGMVAAGPDAKTKVTVENDGAYAPTAQISTTAGQSQNTAACL